MASHETGRSGSSWWRRWALGLAWGLLAAPALAGPLPVVVDLDIGDDIDDSFALALLLQQPGIELLGIGTVWGDTVLRARLVDRLLAETGRTGIPVHAGVPTPSQIAFTQARWASGPHVAGAPGLSSAPPRFSAPARAAGTAIDFMLEQARRRPGEVTLLALGPLTNVAEALRRDPAGFAGFRQVVLMGGSVRVGYSRNDWQPPTPPAREYNVAADTAAARAVFASGVPIVMLPLDATAVRLDDQRRAAIFSHGSALTDALALMYLQWTNAAQPWISATPTLFDVVPVAWLVSPQRCPLVPLRIEVGDQGETREVAGAPNARVCLEVDRTGVLDDLMRALLQ